MPQFDYAGAIKAGHSEGDIASFLQAQKSKGVDLYIDRKQYNQNRPDHAGARSFSSSPTPKVSVGKEFLKGLAPAAAQTVLGGPVKLLTSGVEGINQTIKNGGNASGKTYHAPLIGDFKSFQSDANDRMKQGQNPILNIGQAALGTAGAGLDTMGAIEGTKAITAGGTSLINRLGSGLKGGTLEDVLKTAEKDVYKLNPTERKAWFANKQAAIDTTHNQASQQIKTNLDKSAEQITQTSKDLQRQLQVASRDKVIELRPKIVKAMGEQSKTYRSLIDAEMAGKEKVPVNIADLKAHIDAKYGDNPGLSDAIKNRLELVELSPKPLKPGELPVIQTKEPTKTLGQLYSKIKSLKQDISTGAVKGSKVFTPDDKLTDDAIHILTDFMKGQGIDFTKANKFWAAYAPVRNQLVTEAKPFLQTGVQTKTFAQTLTRVAKGTDVNNEHFINEVEALLKEPITKETKTVVKQLDANEKAGLASKIEAETKSMESKLATEKASKQLSDKQYEIERRARTRSIVKKVLLTAGGFSVDKIVKKYTGIGF